MVTYLGYNFWGVYHLRLACEHFVESTKNISTNLVNPPKLIHWFYVTCDMNVFYPGHIISRLWDVNWRWNQHLYVSHCNILISILEADSNIKIRREHYQMQINFNLMQISRKAGTAGDKRILLIFLVKTQVLRLLSILILKVSIFTIQWIPAHPSRKSTRSPRQTVGVFLARTLQSRLVCRLSFFCLFFVPVLYRKTYFPLYDHFKQSFSTPWWLVTAPLDWTWAVQDFSVKLFTAHQKVSM